MKWFFLPVNSAALGVPHPRMSSLRVETVAFIALWVKPTQTTRSMPQRHKPWEPLTSRQIQRCSSEEETFRKIALPAPRKPYREPRTCLGYSAPCANGPRFSPLVIWTYLFNKIHQWALDTWVFMFPHLLEAFALSQSCPNHLFSRLLLPPRCLPFSQTPLQAPWLDHLTNAGENWLGPHLLYATLPSW